MGKTFGEVGLRGSQDDVSEKRAPVDRAFAAFETLRTLQVNLGNLCNLRCVHCHHNASPDGTRIMGRNVMDRIILFLKNHPGPALDITGGCPEMNPDFRYFVEATSGLVERRIVRSNLAIAVEAGMEWLPEFYRDQNLVVMASLPCYGRENVDSQRGSGVFFRSIEALRRLNQHGYGKSLELHLVYNPGGNSLAPEREVLEQHYRRELLEKFGICFSRLHCMNNAPLGRYRKLLEETGAYQGYLDRLAETFNPEAVPEIMCRTLLSVGWDGSLYNCDFNVAAGLPLHRDDGSVMGIAHIDEALQPGSPIIMADHCFSCTAGNGSGCGGSIAKPEGAKISASTSGGFRAWRR